MRPLALVLLLMASLTQPGCGGSDNLCEVWGTVTYEGQPVPRGRIDFEPDPARGNSGPGGFAEIRDGYFTTATGRNVVGGAMIVRISGSDGESFQTEGGEVDPIGRRLFDDYTTQIEMPQEDTELNFEVPPGGGAETPAT